MINPNPSKRIVIVGCSHGRHDQLTLPQGDILVHTGDFSRRGDESDAISFLRWFESQSHCDKAFICGNHERYAEAHPEAFVELVKRYAPSCHYLHEKSLMAGGLKWYGSNTTPTFMRWSFMADRGEQIQQHWDLIPDDVNVLITHGPAYGHLDLVPVEYVENGRDRHQGCMDLKTTIETRLSKLKCHAFSHLHSQGNQTEVVNGVTYINASVVGEDYRVRGDIQVIEL